MRYALHLATASLLAMALAGCGTTHATLATAPAPVAALAAPAPTLAVTSAAVAVAPTVTLVAGVTVKGMRDMSDGELQADAAAVEGSGYHVEDAIAQPVLTGYVRRGDGANFLLQASNDQFGKSGTFKYTLLAPDPKTYSFLGAHVNQRVHVDGQFNPNYVVTVATIDTAFDLSWLTNWWTKGKVEGLVRSTTGLPIVDVEAKLRSSEGYIFTAETDNTGAYTLPDLAAGSYQMTFTKAGYGVQSGPCTVASHKATTVEGALAKH